LLVLAFVAGLGLEEKPPSRNLTSGLSRSWASPDGY